MLNPSYDCIVIGGGPAGSTAAALVAEAGFSTLLVERETHPRPHVGESLMPESYWVFERLGVLEELDRMKSFAKKVGVQFVNNTGRESQPFFFRSHDPRPCSETWHVLRSEFDQLLFNNAAKKGATCIDNTRVLDVHLTGDRATGVSLQTADGPLQNISAQVIIDATGQHSLIANKLGLKKVNPELKKAAIWRHYRGAKRDESGGGVKTLVMHTTDAKCWFWYIPQGNDLVSVGLVGNHEFLLKGRGTPEETFEEELAKCHGAKVRVKDAEPCDDLRVVKEFSYTTTRSAGDGWTLVGDAWGFIDPVYSSGVYFALQSAMMGADSVIAALKSGDTSAAKVGAWVEEFSTATRWVRKLVNAFYSGRFRVGKFVMEHPEHAAGLTDLLIGRIFGPNTGKIFDDLEPWMEQMDPMSDVEVEVAGAPVLA